MLAGVSTETEVAMVIATVIALAVMIAAMDQGVAAIARTILTDHMVAEEEAAVTIVVAEEATVAIVDVVEATVETVETVEAVLDTAEAAAAVASIVAVASEVVAEVAMDGEVAVVVAVQSQPPNYISWLFDEPCMVMGVDVQVEPEGANRKSVRLDGHPTSHLRAAQQR